MCIVIVGAAPSYRAEVTGIDITNESHLLFLEWCLSRFVADGMQEC
jgi:hypothetical protein